MLSSVCYFYFKPVIDKRQQICYAVILLWCLILISLFNSTVVTKENLHLKKVHNNNEYVELEWTLIFHELFH